MMMWPMADGGWIAMMIFWVVILGLIVWLASRVFPSGSTTSSARATLDERFARGEIDVTEYRDLRRELER